MQSKRTPATQVEKQAEEHSAKDMRAAVKKLARSYRDMKNYIAYIQNKRPTLLKQAKVDLREYKSRGLVTYADYVSLFPKSDRDIIEAYVKCLRGVYCLEQGIFLIKDERTRAIASDMLLASLKCDKVMERYNLSRSSVCEEKKKAIEKVAEFMKRYENQE